jgi:YVTN family beta-propeller protein
MRRWTLVISALLSAALLWGCGGNGNNSGGGNITVSVSPAAVSILVNQLQQFVATVTGAQVATIASSNGAVRSGNVVTITTTAAHRVSVGHRVIILGVTDATFNGTFTVASVPSSTTFTYNQNGPDATSGGGSVSNITVTWFVNDVQGGNATVGTITQEGVYTAPAALPPPTTATIAANNGASRSSNVVTITTTAAHDFLAGQIVTITGVADSTFNGTFVVSTVPSQTTFTYGQNGPNATSGGGTASSTAVKVKAVSVVDEKASATAIVSIDSGVRVTVTPKLVGINTGETLQFTATVSGTSNTNVTWFVNDIEGGNTTVGTISATGLYTAPATPPTPASVGIKAVSQFDPKQFDIATVTVFPAADPVLNSVSPARVAQNSLFQDFYLEGENFRGTTTVRVNGVPVGGVPITTRLFRVRLTADQLSTPGTLVLDMERQNGNLSAPVPVTVEPVRPAVVGTSPDSAPQSGPAVSINLNGGFYSSSLEAAFAGQIRAATVINARQMNVALSPSDLTTAGLFPLLLRNPDAGAVAAINLAVQPAAAVPSVVTTIGVGAEPSAVAVNTATGTAVVANRAGNSASVINLTTFAVTTIPVGTTPTGVAVDNERNLALVVNNGSKDVTVINLATGTVVATVPVPPFSPGGTPPSPFAVGINPLSGLALVAHQSSNFASVFDLDSLTFVDTIGGGQQTVSTGDNPSVAVEPQLDWAVVTPGGAGALTIVDLGRRNVVATVAVGSGVRGVGINTETQRIVLTNPTSNALILFSLADQTVENLTLEQGHVAAAANPLSDVAVTVNPSTDLISVINLRTPPSRLATLATGTDPVAVALDPTTNRAVVANQADNSVSIVDLGSLRSLHLIQVNPAVSLTSNTDLTLSVTGNGFLPGAVVRLDEAPLTTTFVSARRLTATIPAALLATARRFVVDVLNPGGEVSNAASLAVFQAIAVGDAPVAVAIDPERDLAIVTNSGSDNISVVDLTTGTVVQTVAVGINPQGVAISSRLGRAIVANRGSNSATFVDLDTFAVIANIAVGSEPTGVAVDSEDAVAVVTNTASNSVTVIDAATTATLGTVSVDQGPVAVAIDTSRNLAAVANATQNTLNFVSLTGTPSFTQRIPGFQLPTGVAYDPAADRFVVTSSLTNNLSLVNPENGQSLPLRVGINPTAVALNYLSGTLVTFNRASRTLSVIDLLDRRVRAVFGMEGSTRYSLDIHPRTNIAVIADEAQDRILLVPLPR